MEARQVIRRVARETRLLAIAIESSSEKSLSLLLSRREKKIPEKELAARRFRVIDTYKSRNRPRRCCGISALINAFPRLRNLGALRVAKCVTEA